MAVAITPFEKCLAIANLSAAVHGQPLDQARLQEVANKALQSIRTQCRNNEKQVCAQHTLLKHFGDTTPI